ncbi:hypothetical protein ES703_80766 [subsurface metagenome]
MDTIRAFGILLHSGRNLKKQGLARRRRRALLLIIRNILHSFPMQAGQA